MDPLPGTFHYQLARAEKRLERLRGPLTRPENDPPPIYRSLDGSRRTAMYGLAWKLSEEENLLLATPEQVEDNLLFSSAIAVKYVESPLMEKYGRKMQPDYTYMGSLHWHALVLKTNETPPYPMMEEFIQEVMDLYNIKTRPIWYMYASILT